MQPFLGEIRMFAGTFAPVGWQRCDGTLLQIAQNDALYTLMGTTYGGDGISTFAVPDLRSCVPLHQGNSYIIGNFGGAESVVLAPAQAPLHTHTFFCSTDAATSIDAPGAVLATATAVQMYISDSPDGTLAPACLTVAGGSQPHANIQPFGTLAYIVATEGIYPSQS